KKSFVYTVYMKKLTTPEKILRAAHKLFDREGADAVSMRRVAEAVGITPMAIYRHFPNREALLKRLSDDSFNAVAHEWEVHAQHPHLFDHAFSTRRDDARRFPEDFRARQSPTLNVVADAVAEGMRLGVLKRDDPWDVAMTLWAHSHGLIALYRAGRFSYDETRFRTFYLESLGRLIDGIRH